MGLFLVFRINNCLQQINDCKRRFICFCIIVPHISLYFIFKVKDYHIFSRIWNANSNYESAGCPLLTRNDGFWYAVAFTEQQCFRINVGNYGKELHSSVCSDSDYGTESSGSNPLSCEFYHATQLLTYWPVVLNYNCCRGSLRWMT